MGNFAVNRRTAVVLIICVNNIPCTSCFSLKVVAKSTFRPDSSSFSFMLMQIPSNQVYILEMSTLELECKISTSHSSSFSSSSFSPSPSSLLLADGRACIGDSENSTALQSAVRLHWKQHFYKLSSPIIQN